MSAPQPLAPPVTNATWLGSELAATPERWTRVWSDREISDVLGFVDSIDLDQLGVEPERELARLPAAPASLTALAETITHELTDGLGFMLLTGFPLDELPEATVATSFLAFGSLVGRPRSQNAAGHLLGHVKNVGADINDPATRIYQTNKRQTFHTDSSDCVALLCLRPSIEGGASMLVSVEATYRIMVERDPALAARLFDPIATDRRDEQPEGEQPWFEIPALSWFDDHLTVIYQRQYIESAARFVEAPQPDDDYRRALDLFDEIMNDPTVHLAMEFTPGDIQFVHNHGLLHDRTGFVDDPDPTKRRHLLRLWLSIAGDRQLPAVFAQRYGSIAVGDRGGIMVPGTKLCVPLDA